MPGLPYEWDEDKREYTLTIRGVDFVIVEQADWTAAIHRRSDRGGELLFRCRGGRRHSIDSQTQVHRTLADGRKLEHPAEAVRA